MPGQFNGGHRAPALAEKSPAGRALPLPTAPHAHQESKAMACMGAEKPGLSHRCHHCVPCYETVHQAGAAPS